jgi:signal transduction histidine kinase
MKFLTDTKNPINNQLCKLVSITGNTITVDVTVFPIQYGGKQVFQTIARDITEHVTVLEKLRIREKELSAIFDVLPDQLLLFTIDGVLIDFNSPKKYLFPKSSKLAKNNKIENLYPKEIAGKISEAIHQSIIKDEIVHFDYQIEVQYKKRYFENRVIPLSNDEVILLVREITSEKTTRKLLEDSQKQLRSFALHLQNIREEERIMLSRELHDNLGQSLTALRMDMFRLLKKTEFLYSENLMREQNAMVKKTIEYIDTIIQYVRKLSREIRPSIIDDLGLFATIEWQAEDFMERTGINCKLETSLTKLELNNSCAIGVFRIIQESLTNIIRHANATNVVIEIIETKIEFCIKIKDNGSGFDLALLKRTKSLGVLSMQERTALFGGQLRIISNPNKGTTISLTIPITQKKND